MPTSSVEVRARKSGGISNDAILRMVCRTLERRQVFGECVVDVGCGAGYLHSLIGERFSRYVGVDVVRYDEFPRDAEFCYFDLDTARIPLPDNSADLVAAVEVIEHLENPRDFMRKLVRLAKPGGYVLVTTPNQLSLLSLLSLICKDRFQAFQDVHYPAHLTALLEIDLRRIANECGVSGLETEYSLESRLPWTACSYPGRLSRLFPRRLSDNVLLIGQKG